MTLIGIQAADSQDQGLLNSDLTEKPEGLTLIPAQIAPLKYWSLRQVRLRTQEERIIGVRARVFRNIVQDTGNLLQNTDSVQQNLDNASF